MAFSKVTLAYVVILALVEAKWHTRKREIDEEMGICDPRYTNKTRLQCYCMKEYNDPSVIKSAECYLGNNNVESNDEVWNEFKIMKNVKKLVFTNTRGVVLKYIPTKALKIVNKLMKLDIKYNNIPAISSYAISNMSSIEEIALRDNQIETLETNAFANNEALKTINLDKNNIVEINRDVFTNLPSLERLFLTSNKITTIHDKAFVHLHSLIELEINSNKLFSLNAESFSGLHKLNRLDLSGNSLQVIGDNTFLPLSNLESLNLERNQIEVIDGKALHGLNKLKSMSLAYNKISDLSGSTIFDGLYSLNSLSLRANKLKEISREAIAPILNNFYASSSNLDVEDNELQCNCSLEWFMDLMNKTANSQLKLVIYNLKCTPSPELQVAWQNIEEAEKASSQSVEEDGSPQTGDYEYYDDKQLNGKLFYSDVRELINCTTKNKPHPNIISVPSYTEKPSLIVPTTTVKTIISTTRKVVAQVENHGLLDLYESEDNDKEKPERKAIRNDEEKKKNSVTTSRLPSVSEKPSQENLRYDAMASDEGKPDKMKTHRSLQEESKDPQKPKYNAAPKLVTSFSLFISIIIAFVC